MKLYWVTTEDHDEDWFVIASSQKEAVQLHEKMEGYDPGDATAEEVLEIPETMDFEAGWPSNEILSAVGAKFLLTGLARVVEIGDRKFCEGIMEETLTTLEDDMFELIGQGRVNKTRKPSVQ
jgi:hypothetical protein